MPITIEGKGIGRPDYSSGIERTIPTPRKDLKVREQSSYWAVIWDILPPGVSRYYLVGQGFSIGDPWVPPKQRFILEKIVVSASASVGLGIDVYVQESSRPYEFALIFTKNGFGNISESFEKLRPYKSGERPLYCITNFGDVDVFVTLTIIGMVEVLE